MPIVDIYAGDLLIGEAVLDEIDEGMGVAVGAFHPTSRYPEVRAQITAAAEARVQKLPSPTVDLQARSKVGKHIATGFVMIDDFADMKVDPEATIQFENREEWLHLQGSAV
jgi:hypothetical protein